VKTELVLTTSGARSDLILLGKELISKFFVEGWQVEDEKQFFLWLEWIRVQVTGSKRHLKNGIDSQELILIEEVFVRNRNKGCRDSLRTIVRMLLKQHIYQTDHEYYGRKFGPRVNGPASFQMRCLEKVRYPASNFIGVGYRDSGNARITSKDGTPSWQEVATTNQSEQHWNLSKAKADQKLSLALLFNEIVKGARGTPICTDFRILEVLVNQLNHE